MSTNEKKLRWWELSDNALKDRSRHDVLLQKKVSCEFFQTILHFHNLKYFSGVEKEKKICFNVLDSEKRNFKSEMQKVLPKTNRCNFLSVVAKKIEYEKQQTTEKVYAFCGQEFKKKGINHSEVECHDESKECQISNWKRLSTPVKKNRLENQHNKSII